MSEAIVAAVPEFIRFDNLTLDVGGRALWDSAGRDLALTRSEFELLMSFVRAPGRALSREYLLDAVGGRRGEPYDRSIDMLVGRLRRKIEPQPKHPRLIVTLPGFGYKFATRPRALPPPPAWGDETAEGVPPRQPRAAERRHLTIMLCALSDATRLSARMDPEELHRIVAAFHACCADVITRFGGGVSLVLADRIVAFFGHPRANEYDAEQAVRAGLRAVEAVPGIEAGMAGPLHARVAIATGPVVVAYLLGAGPAGQATAIGETPNLAAALLSVAPADSVVIAATTRRLIGGRFDARASGPLTLEGFAELIEAWEVVGESTADACFAAARGAGGMPLQLG